MGIYHWNLGDIALARLCKKVYAKVRVVKDGKGLFYDDKVLGITAKSDGSVEATKELCYYVEVCRSGEKLWLPYTCMYLAERGRPFYGSDKIPEKKTKPEKEVVPKKRKSKEDYTLHVEVKIPKNMEVDLNTTFDTRHMALKQGRYENAFSEFIRRGKEALFDHFYCTLERDADTYPDALDYVRHVDASTEDKIESAIKNYVGEKEIDNYLRQCWRYKLLIRQSSVLDPENDKENVDPNTMQAVTVHTGWCLVCGEGAATKRLKECSSCPAVYHLACRREWLVTIIHRKNPPQKPQPTTTFVKKILSSTRAITSKNKEKDNYELCPSCMWGPKVGYDDVVWHKLGQCSWWPARVLAPGAVPACLLARHHSKHQWPLRYYGTLNHAWGERSRMCLFLPAHSALAPKDPMLQQAILDACDDYITVYLT